MTDELEPATPVTPHEPPRMDPALPVIDAVIGPLPEDFVVDEVPLYAHSGAGEHLYVRVEKRGYTTPAMLRAVTRAAGVDERDVGYAGLKDKHAVTRQWLSLPSKARAPSEWQLPEGISVVEHTRHSNKLRTGHLLGNRFRITLDTPDLGALEAASVIATQLRARGLFNYFGGQRFGRRGDGLRQAIDWLRAGGKVHGLPRFLSKLYPSVIQAEVFNRYFSARRALGLDRLLVGEVHLTGPIFGPKARPASGDAAALERSVGDELGLGPEALANLGRLA